MLKRTISIIMAVTVILTTTSFLSASQLNAVTTGDEASLVKDETVYVNLNEDGSIRKTTVVSHVSTPRAGKYTDFGRYADIKSLSGDLKPTIEGDRVIWQLPASDAGFYYQGTLSDREAPFDFSILYSLDGRGFRPTELIGRSGKVEMTVKVTPSQKVSSYFKDSFLCQLQIPLPLDRVSNISAPGAQGLIVGKTRTLAYMVLPGKSKEFKISFDAKRFEMDSISATILPFDPKDLLEIDPAEIESGVAEISLGTGTVISGTEQLRDGVSALAIGIKAAAYGATDLAVGAGELKTGMTSYMAGVDEVSATTRQVAGGVSQLSESGSQVLVGYERLSGGISALLDSLAPLISSLPAEQGASYAQQIGYLRQQITTYGKGLTTYTVGVTQSALGLSALSSGVETLAKGHPALIAGVKGIHSGATQLQGGLEELAAHSSRLPSEIQKLINGQRQLQSGITGATELFGSFAAGGVSTERKPVSFADQGHPVNSVQFVVRTPELKAHSAPLAQPIERKQISFWERLMRLFR